MIRAFFFALFLLPLQLSAATKVQEVVSPGGIRAWLVEEHSIPMIAIELEFTGGVETDPVDRVGVSDFLGAMLDEGAGDLDATAFRNRADDLSLRMGAEAGRTSFSVSARMLLENRDESLELLRLALSAPRFDPEPLARVRSQILSGIRSDATDPQSIATKRWRELMLDALLGGLSDTPAQEVPTPVFAPERGVEVVPFETPQSVAVLGHEGLSRDDPDFIAATVMNQILGGGGFSSRLTEEVREKRGLTYSVYSYISPRPDEVGVYMAGVSADNARIAEAIEVIRAEWRRMAEGGVTADELEKTKRYLTGAYPLRFDSNAKIASMLAAIQHAGLGVDYIDRRNDLVEAVTQEDVARVAKRLLHDDRLRIVVVGQPVGITTN
jgi:zinc protease